MKVSHYNQMMGWLTGPRYSFYNGGRVGFASGTPFAITDSNLAKIHTLIQNTDLSLKEIGKKIGFGTDKKPMDSTSKVFREYVKKYGEPDKIRLQTRGVKLTKDSPYVKNVIKSVEEVGVRETARRFGKERKTIRNVLHRFRKDLIKDINVKGKETSATKSKIKAKENIKIAETKAGPKTTKQTKDVISKIAEYNEPYKKMSAKNLAKDKNFLKRLRMHIDINTGEVTYDGYTKARPVRGKVFTDLELADHAIKKANQGQLFTHDHIKPKKLQKQDIGYPRNLQPATYIENSNFNNARDYVLNNPKGDTSAIDKYLTKNNQTLRFPDQKIKLGYKGVIEYSPAKGTHTLIDKPVKPSRGGVTLGSNFANVNPREAKRLIDFSQLGEDVKNITKDVTTSPNYQKAKSILGKTAGKVGTKLTQLDAPIVAAPFTAYSVADLASDIARGEETDVMALDITLPLAFTDMSSKALDLYNPAKTNLGSQVLRAGLSPQLASKILPTIAKGSVWATPLMELGIQGYNARQEINKAMSEMSVLDREDPEKTEWTPLGRAPKTLINKWRSEAPDIDAWGAANGGIASLTRTTPPERGPQHMGLDYLRKHGRGY